MANESGFNGRLLSLANLPGVPGRGRQTDPTNWTITGDTQILNENGRRISAIIQNTGVNNATLYFGNDALGLTLLPNANFQIDSLFPWTGTMRADSVNTTIEVIEVSLYGG